MATKTEKKIIEAINNKLPVVICHNHELDDWRWSVALADEPEFWLNAFVFRAEAERFCEENELPVVKIWDERNPTIELKTQDFEEIEEEPKSKPARKLEVKRLYPLSFTENELLLLWAFVPTPESVNVPEDAVSVRDKINRALGKVKFEDDFVSLTDRVTTKREEPPTELAFRREDNQTWILSFKRHASNKIEIVKHWKLNPGHTNKDHDILEHIRQGTIWQTFKLLDSKLSKNGNVIGAKICDDIVIVVNRRSADSY